MKKHAIDMIHGPLLPRLLAFSIPLVLSGVLQLLFNAADIVVVGRWAGRQALAAVGSNTHLISLMLNLFVGLSIGVNVAAARFFGAGEERELTTTVHTAITLALYSGVFLLLLGLVGAPTFLGWMSCPDDILPLAALYLRLYFLSMPGVMLYNFGGALLRAKGDTQRPLWYLSFAGVVNVVLNLFLVICLNMGVAGVGIATMTSQLLSGLLVMRCLCRETDSLHLDLKRLRLDREKFFLIVRIGLPAGLQGIVFSLSNVVVQSSVNSFGSVAMAGDAAACNLENFIYTSMNAIYQTCLTFTGQNIGAGNARRADRVLIQCQLIVVTLAMVMGFSFVAAGPQLLHIYSPDPSVIAAGMIRMRHICLPYFLCGMMDVMVGSIRGMGHSIAPTVVAIAGCCGFRMFWVAVIFRAKPSLDLLYLSYPVSWALVFLVHLLCFLVIRKQVHRMLNGKAQPSLAEIS